MKANLSLLLAVLSFSVSAQTKIDKTVPVRNGQVVKMKFDYPELVKVSTWDKNEVSIRVSVSINEGENDDAFELTIDNSGNTIMVENRINNLKNLPRRVTVTRHGEKMVFRNEAEWKKYQDEHGRSFSNVIHGVDMDIEIEVKIPKQVDTTVELVYGTLEVENFTGPLVARSTYGGVDAALTERNLGELSAETNYGKIYSNLDVNFDNSKSRNEAFHTYVYAKPGSGSRYIFESKYGNVYLRKSN
jgi:hypothetical protein